MNTWNSKKIESNRFICQSNDKFNLKNPNNKNIGVVNLSIYYTRKYIKSAYNNNKFKISTPTWSEEFDLQLESVGAVLVHCNLVNKSYQKASKVLFTFVPNKKFGQLNTISPHLLTMLKTANTEFQSIELWFADQNKRPLEIKDIVNITLIIG